MNTERKTRHFYQSFAIIIFVEMEKRKGQVCGISVGTCNGVVHEEPWGRTQRHSSVASRQKCPFEKMKAKKIHKMRCGVYPKIFFW